MMEFSPLEKTWMLDIDGTILKHNGHLNGGDELLEGVKEFFDNLHPNDKVIFFTSRKEEYIEEMKAFLSVNNIRFDHIISDMPFGERILVNDKKTSGLNTAYAINKDRDSKLVIEYKINENL